MLWLGSKEYPKVSWSGSWLAGSGHCSLSALTPMSVAAQVLLGCGLGWRRVWGRTPEPHPSPFSPSLPVGRWGAFVPGCPLSICFCLAAHQLWSKIVSQNTPPVFYISGVWSFASGMESGLDIAHVIARTWFRSSYSFLLPNQEMWGSLFKYITLKINDIDLLLLCLPDYPLSLLSSVDTGINSSV